MPKSHWTSRIIPTTDPRSLHVNRRRHPKAFTTIELIVAISILVILAGLIFVGFKSVGGGGKTRATRALLESARGLVGEVDASGGMASLKSIYQAPASPPAYAYSFPP